MHKEKIYLPTIEAVNDFVNMCSKYNCDINLYRGKRVIDAKSILGVLSVGAGKTVEVQIVSSNEDVIVDFLNNVKKYRCDQER